MKRLCFWQGWLTGTAFGRWFCLSSACLTESLTCQVDKEHEERQWCLQGSQLKRWTNVGKQFFSNSQTGWPFLKRELSKAISLYSLRYIEMRDLVSYKAPVFRHFQHQKVLAFVDSSCFFQQMWKWNKLFFCWFVTKGIRPKV